jgi:hypothetical protein
MRDSDDPLDQKCGPKEYEALTGIGKAEYERRCPDAAREAFAAQQARFLGAEVVVERAGDGTGIQDGARLAGEPDADGVVWV